ECETSTAGCFAWSLWNSCLNVDQPDLACLRVVNSIGARIAQNEPMIKCCIINFSFRSKVKQRFPTAVRQASPMAGLA
ncbi:MAG: hypothetical protein ACI9YG_001223, partial [Candidatus Azotimanducaceae bacterium]